MENKKPPLKKKLTLKERFGSASTGPGSCLRPIYAEVFDEKTNSNKIKVIKKVDAYKERQGYASCCDYEIAKKQILLGQVPVDDSSLVFADLSFMPHNIHEAFEIANKAAEKYDALPQYLKDAFGSLDGFTTAIRENKANKIVSIAAQKEMIRQKEASQPAKSAEEGEK